MRWLGASAAVLLALVSCGGSSGVSPTPRQYVQGLSTLTGPLGAGATYCEAFDNATRGPVNAVAEPTYLVVALAGGSCAAPGAVLAEGTGEANAVMPAGIQHVRVTNPRDADVQLHLRLRRWY